MDRRDHATPENVYCGDLVRESRALSSSHFQVTGDTTLVPCHGEFQVFLGCDHSFLLDLSFFLEDAQCGKVVFHLLKAGKHGLAIGRHRLLVNSDRLV